MTYAVKEMFLTLQGEGVNAGARAVFVRFAGCNLWSGREQDRATAVCRFCDTDFVGTDGLGGGKFADAAALVAAVVAFWGPGRANRFVVLTGGEPMLQVDDALVDALHAAGCRIAIETNGTLPVHPRIDWVCVSPEGGEHGGAAIGRRAEARLAAAGNRPIDVVETWDFAHRLLQPLDDPAAAANRDACVAAVLERPWWRLSLQTHKLLGLRVDAPAQRAAMPAAGGQFCAPHLRSCHSPRFRPAHRIEARHRQIIRPGIDVGRHALLAIGHQAVA